MNSEKVQKDQMQKDQVWKYLIQKDQVQNMRFRRTIFRRYSIYLLEQPCFVGTFYKRHIAVNFPSLSVDQYWFLPRVSSMSVLPNSKLILHTTRKSQPGPGPAHFAS